MRSGGALHTAKRLTILVHRPCPGMPTTLHQRCMPEALPCSHHEFATSLAMARCSCKLSCATPHTMQAWNVAAGLLSVSLHAPLVNVADSSTSQLIKTAGRNTAHLSQAAVHKPCCEEHERQKSAVMLCKGSWRHAHIQDCWRRPAIHMRARAMYTRKRAPCG